MSGGQTSEAPVVAGAYLDRTLADLAKEVAKPLPRVSPRPAEEYRKDVIETTNELAQRLPYGQALAQLETIHRGLDKRIAPVEASLRRQHRKLRRWLFWAQYGGIVWAAIAVSVALGLATLAYAYRAPLQAWLVELVKPAAPQPTPQPPVQPTPVLPGGRANP